MTSPHVDDKQTRSLFLRETVSDFSILIPNYLSSFFLLSPQAIPPGVESRSDRVGSFVGWRRALPKIVFAAGRRCAGRCERALLSIALDVGRRRAAGQSWGTLPTIIFAAGCGCAGRRGRALSTIVFDAGRRRAGRRGALLPRSSLLRDAVITKQEGDIFRYVFSRALLISKVIDVTVVSTKKIT